MGSPKAHQPGFLCQGILDPSLSVTQIIATNLFQVDTALSQANTLRIAIRATRSFFGVFLRVNF